MVLAQIKGLNKTDKGIYMISLISPTLGRKSKLVKIGMSRTSLKTRLDQYHTCFHSSFYTYFVVVCSDPYKFEQALHKKLEKYRYTHHEYQARIKSEWFDITNTMIHEAMESTISQYKKEVKKIFCLPHEDEKSNIRSNFRKNMPRMQIVKSGSYVY